jgi:hypothetical protein
MFKKSSNKVLNKVFENIFLKKKNRVSAMGLFATLSIISNCHNA